MARPTLTTHRKFRRLARLLGGQAVARGTLELLWDVAYAAGEARIGDALDVEEAAQWQGERGACVAALVACGFLDADPDGESFEVHDLWHHCPDYVARRAQREAARREKGTSLSQVRRQAAKKRWAHATEGHLHAKAADLHAPDMQLNAHTYSAPAPAPNTRTQHTHPPAAPSTGAEVSVGDVWEAWTASFQQHAGTTLALTPRGRDATHLQDIASGHVPRDELEACLRLFFEAPSLVSKWSLGMFTYHLPQLRAWARTHPDEPYGDARAVERDAERVRGQAAVADFLAAKDV